MANYIVQGPDGGKHVIQGPDDASPDQIEAFANQTLGVADPKPAPVDSGRAMTLTSTAAPQDSPVDQAADARVSQEAAGGLVPQPSVAKGLPFGSWLDEASAGLDAGLNKVSGGRIGQPYDQGIAYQHARDRYIDKNSPNAQTAASLAGAIGTAPSLPALDLLKGGGMIADGGNALMNAFGYGALYGSGDDSGQGRAANALQGGENALAIAAPLYPAARVFGNALATSAGKNPPLPSQLSQYDPRAVKTMADLFSQDQLDRPITGYNSHRALLGQPGVLGDMGPNNRAVLQGLAKRPGPEMSTIVKTISGRQQGAEGRIDTAVDQAMGAPVNVPLKIEQMQAAKRAAAAPLYQQFHATSIPVTPEIRSALSRVPRSAFAEAQKLAQAEGYKKQFRLRPVDEPMTPMTGMQGTSRREQIPTGLEYDYIKRAVDDMANTPANRGTNAGRVYGNVSRDLRGAVDSTLNPANPAASSWAVARKAAGEHLKLQEAFEYGQQAFAKNLSANQLAYDMRNMSPEERQMVQIGGRSQIAAAADEAGTKAGSNADTKTRAMLQTRNAQKKLNLLVGNRSAATNLNRTLESETRFDNTAQKTLQNSDTALYQAAQRKVPGDVEINASLHNLSWEGAIAVGTKKIVDTLTSSALTSRNMQHAADVARMLIAQGAKRDDIASGLIQVIKSRTLSPAQRSNAYRAAAKVLTAVAAGPNIDARRRAVIPTIPVTR